MRLLLVAFLVFVAAVGALAAAAHAASGWAGVAALLGTLVIGLLIVFRFAGYFLKKIFMAPFQAKGAVLRDAGVEVHGIETADAPAEYDGPPRRWLLVDVTVRPVPRQSQPFTMWEVDDITVAGPDARAEDEDADDGIGDIQHVSIWRDNAWRDDDIGKHTGPQRLRMHIGLDPDVKRFRFRYYFELFGNISVPY